MAGKGQEYRIFVGGLAWDVTERQLENAFARFGKILDCQVSSIHVVLERDTGRPRGFGFLAFADRHAMDDAIREMHGRKIGDRAISVNRAQPKMGAEDSDHGYGGGYSSDVRGSYGGGDRSVGQDDCFKCGRLGHWARDCPLAVGGRVPRPISPQRSRFGGVGGRGDRYGVDRDRYMDDRGRYGNRERFDSRDDRYLSGGRYVGDRYPSSGDQFVADRFGGSDRYPQYGYVKDRGYDRDEGPRGSSDRYGVGGPTRYEGRNYRDRSGPYDCPRRGGRPLSFDRY